MKKMYEILSKFTPKVVDSPLKNRPVSSLQDSNTGSKDLAWDQKNGGLGLQFENGGRLVMLKEPAYVFRTSIGSMGFSSGQHYWEIIPDLRTENELKVGVTTTINFDLNTAFCDHIFGFAYYGLGQLRHNSNASGPQYGKRMKKEGVLGIFLNMDKGQLSFSLNGENLGVAFTHDGLKKGPIYPAVALLHCAGCTIKGELPIPSIFK
jgi:E3 ubiquitin-protein ligase NRDP1